MKINLTIPGNYCAGLGDCITWAWIAEAGGLEFVAGGRGAEMLNLMGCKVGEDPADSVNPHSCHLREMAERGARPRVEIWCDNLGIPCEPRRPKIGIEFGGVFRRRVALCPHVHWRAREWPKAYWLDLCFELMKKNVQPVWIMEHKDLELLDRCNGRVSHWFGQPMAEVAKLLQSCAVVVGNDSMPVHLGGTIGRPTLALLGPTKPTIFAHMPSVKGISTDLVDCVGCHFGRPSNKACDLMCQALAMLSPQKVADIVSIVVEEVGHAARRVSSSVSADEKAAVGG